jgi:hypothetical protein
LATWSRADGDLRASFAGSSFACTNCTASSGGSAGTSLPTWSLPTWTTLPLDSH